MKIVLQPHVDFVTVTIEDDEDAKLFCDAACDLWSEGAPPHVQETLKESYDKTAEIMVRDNTAHWDRELWDAIVQTETFAGVSISLSFGAALIHKIGII